MSRSGDPRSTDARMVRSSEAMRRALLTLIAERPYEQIAVREIAREAGVSIPTFYRQFDSKDALLDQIASAEIDRLFAVNWAMQRLTDTRASALAFCDYVESRKSLWRILLTTGATAVLREAFIARARIVGEGHERANPSLPIDLLAPFAVSGIFEILSWWLRQDDDVTRDEVAELLELLVMEPMLRNRRRMR